MSKRQDNSGFSFLIPFGLFLSLHQHASARIIAIRDIKPIIYVNFREFLKLFLISGFEQTLHGSAFIFLALHIWVSHYEGTRGF